MAQIRETTIIKQLESFCDKYDTYGKAAKALKVTSAQLSQTRNRKNNVIPERILKKLGYKSEVVYTYDTGKVTAAPKKPAAKPKNVPAKVETMVKKGKDIYAKVAKEIVKKAAEPAKAPRPTSKPAVLAVGYIAPVVAKKPAAAHVIDVTAKE